MAEEDADCVLRCAGEKLPIRLWMALALWLGLGLGRKPEDRPEVDDGEREGAALLLLGVLRGLLEVVEQPRVASYHRTEEK